MDLFNLERSPILNLFKKPKPIEARVIPTVERNYQYQAANTDRLTNDWASLSGGSIDNAIRGSFKTVRNRAEEEFRNGNGIHAVRCFTNDIIGEGIPMESEVLLPNGDMNEAVNEMIESEWKEWCRAENCHTQGVLDFNEIEKMTVHEQAVSGDMLVRMIRQPFGSSKVPFALELIPARQLADDWNGKTSEGNEIRLGVEIDKWKRPTAYHIRGWDPGDYSFNYSSGNVFRPERTPASEVIHLYRTDAIGQVRGISWFFPTLVRAHHIKEFEEALLVRARLEACIMGMIITADPVTRQDKYNPQKVSDYMEPGTYKQLKPGESMTPFIPSASGANSIPFLDYELRMAAIALGIAPGKYSGNIKDYNYSGMRGEEMLFRDHWKFERLRHIKMFHQRVFENWLDAAVLSGVIRIPNYFSNRRKYCRPKWFPRKFSYIDPQKEIAGNAEAIASSQTTFTDIAAEYGRDFEEILKTKAREQQLAEKYKVDITSYFQKGGQNANSNDATTKQESSGQTTDPKKSASDSED